MTSHQDIFAVSYKQAIPLTENPSSLNTQSNINRALLVENHIDNFSENVFTTSDKYWLQEEKTIWDILKITSVMKSKIQQIQTTKIEKDIANSVLVSIVEDLKVINNTIKLYFYQEIESIEQYHSTYSSVAIRIAKQLDILTLKLEVRIKWDGIVSDREKQALWYVFELKETSKNLKNFENIKFDKKNEVRAALVRLVKDIKKDIQSLRSL